MTPYEVYKCYIGIGAHFKNKDYDFIKYLGRFKGDTVENFWKRADRYQFEKLSERLNSSDEVHQFFIANFLKNPTYWIGEDGFDEYFIYQGRCAALDRLIEEDLSQIHQLMLKKGLTFDQMIEVFPGKHPALMRLYLSEMIEPETASMLFTGLKIFERWDKSSLHQDITYNQGLLKIRKYASFLDVPALLKKFEKPISLLFKPQKQNHPQ